MKLYVAPVFEALSLTYLTVMLGRALYTHSYIHYVAPRLLPYLTLFTICLAIWALYSWSRIAKPMVKAPYMRYLALIVPAFLLTFPAPITLPFLNQAVAAQGPSEGYYGQGSLAYQVKKQGLEEQKGLLPTGIHQDKKIIIITDKNFYRTLVKLGSHPEDYVGYKVIMIGYASRHLHTLPPKDFVLSRMTMACCIADVAPMGIAAEMKDDKMIPTNTWMTAEGTLSVKKIDGLNQPFMTITKMESARPIPGFVYP